MGGTKNKLLLKISKEIWIYLLDIVGSWLLQNTCPSALNKQANWESRQKANSSEWKLSPKMFQKICNMRGIPQIDLFASRVCHQIQNYVSWRPDPHSQGTDAMTLDWKNKFLYAPPPYDRHDTYWLTKGIWYYKLWNSFSKKSFSNHVVKWFKSYLSNRNFHVAIGNSLSCAGELTCGVPQGSILGPLLFLLYVNDMQQAIDCDLFLYADDSCLVFQHKNVRDIEINLNKNFPNPYYLLLKTKLTKLANWILLIMIYILNNILMWHV